MARYIWAVSQCLCVLCIGSAERLKETGMSERPCPRVRRAVWRLLPVGITRWMIVGLTTVLLALAPLPAARADHTATLPPASGISLTPSLASPQPLGTPIIWTATATDSVALVYRFSVATAAAGPYTVVRDFSPRHSFVWAPLQEGVYYVGVTIQEGYSGTATVSTAVPFTLTSRVSGSQAVVNSAANPLVALYSAPSCAAGFIMVRFREAGTQRWTYTNAQPCRDGLSRNFLVAGMRATTAYQLEHLIVNGGTVTTSPALSFTTGAPSPSLVFPAFSVPQAPILGSDGAQDTVYHDLAAATPGEVNPLATDLQGRVIWYANQPDLQQQDGVRLQQVGGQSGDEVMVFGADNARTIQNGDKDVLRVLNLAGTPLQETNVQAIDRQLVAQGHQIIYGFSHDALVLPNGDIATFGHTQRTITTTAVMGDMLVVLDRNLQVVWSWDAFDHLNPYDGPTLGDLCGTAYPTCPVPGGPNTIDWTHANSIDYTPADGDLLLSLRDLDWVLKIDYANGAGDGHVIWRLGPQGDFRIVPLRSTDLYPWFSHQHDANFVDSHTLTIFDNGDTRCATINNGCYSRGQAYVVDEQNMVVTQTVSANLGAYSDALGTAQRLSNGNYNFTAGVEVVLPPPHGQEIEIRPGGAHVFVQQMNGLEYRAWRLVSLYGPTNPACASCPST